MSKRLLGIVIAVTFLATGVFGWWLIQYWNVDSCYDTDGGFDFLTKGTVYVTIGGGNYSGTDYCIDNYTIGEYACGGDVGYPPGIAGLVGEDCSVTNSSGICFDGSCI